MLSALTQKMSLWFKQHYGQPTAWQSNHFQKLTGKYSTNNRLKGLKRCNTIYGTSGPESIAIDDNGLIYAGFDDGRIIQFNTDGQISRVITNTGGRPLGLRFHPDGSLLVCDVILGLLKVEINTGFVQLLTNSAEGVPFKFTDDLDVTADGKMIYFTDASSQWGYNYDHLEVIEARGNGRLLSYNCISAETKVLMRDLVFANGVTLDKDQQSVLVTETGKYRIHRYWLYGNKAGISEIWVDNLPGMPDNIRFNGKDCFWVALPVGRSHYLDLTAERPSLRIPAMVFAKHFNVPSPRFSCVLGFNLNGELIYNLQDHSAGNYNFITQALEFEGYLYCSSLRENTISRIELKQLSHS